MRWEELVERILALRPDWDAAELGGFRFLEGGYSNENYRFRYRNAEFVVRVPGRPNAYVDRAREQRFYATMASAPPMATMHPSAVPEEAWPDAQMPPVDMPEVIGFDTRSGIMISRWISGRLLADLDPPVDRLVQYLRELHGRLQSNPVAAAAVDRRYEPLAQARSALAAAAAPAWIHEVAEGFEWRPPVLTLCHNDLNPWNVIEVPDGRWFTLDWEWAGANDPLFDLVALHQGLGKEDALLPFLATSLIGQPPEPGRIEACLTAFWLREFSWANAEIAHGSQRPEIVLQRELGERKLKALTARDQAAPAGTAQGPTAQAPTARAQAGNRREPMP